MSLLSNIFWLSVKKHVMLITVFNLYSSKMRSIWKCHKWYELYKIDNLLWTDRCLKVCLLRLDFPLYWLRHFLWWVDRKTYLTDLRNRNSHFSDPGRFNVCSPYKLTLFYARSEPILVYPHCWNKVFRSKDKIYSGHETGHTVIKTANNLEKCI